MKFLTSISIIFLVLSTDIISCWGKCISKNPDEVFKADSLVILQLINQARDQEYKNFKRARDYASRALQMSSDLNSPEIRAEILITWGWINWMNGNYDIALAANQEAIDIWKRLGRQNKIAHNLHSIALVYNSQAYFGKAINTFEQCLEIFREEKDSAMIAQTMLLISVVYYKQADFQKATKYLVESFTYRDKYANYKDLLFQFSELGTFFMNRKIYVDELTFLLSKLDEVLKEQNTYQVATLHQNIGKAYYFLEDYPRSIYWLKKGLYLREKNHYLPVWTDLGDAYLQNGNLDSAEYYYEKSLNDNLKLGPGNAQVISYQRLGKLAAMKDDYNRSEEYYEKALKMNRELNNQYLIADLNAQIAELNLKNNRFKKGILHAKEGLSLAKDINAVSLISELYQITAGLYELSGNYAAAYSYQQKLNKLDRRINNDKTMYQMAILSMQYETEKKQKEIERLNQENKINQSRLKFQSLFSFAATGAVILFFMLAGSQYIRYRQKNIHEKHLSVQKKRLENTNSLLQQRNKEKELLLGEIHHRIKNNLQTVSSILNMQSRNLNQTAKVAIQEGRNRVKTMAMIHKQLYEEDHFSGVIMSDFIENLIGNLLLSYNIPHESIQLDLKLDPISLDIDSAIPIGLIFNELISNAFKHGLKNQENKILYIRFELINDQSILLEVYDSGPGFKLSKKESFGLKLIEGLCNDMKADCHLKHPPESGFQIIIKKFKQVHPDKRNITSKA